MPLLLASAAKLISEYSSKRSYGSNSFTAKVLACLSILSIENNVCFRRKGGLTLGCSIEWPNSWAQTKGACHLA